MFPLWLLGINAFKPQSAILANPAAFPSPPTLAGFARARRELDFVPSALATLLVTAVSAALIAVVSAMAAWMMARCGGRRGRALYYAFTAAMLIPFQAVMYPLLSLFEGMGLKNFPGLVVMYGGFGLAMSVFLYHGFLTGVPVSIEEAALLDGASPPRVFFGIVFPLLGNTTATSVILNAVWIWNDYLLPFLVIGNRAGTKTLTLSLYFARLTAGQYANPWELIFPAVLITILSVVVIFLFLQKRIVRGVAAGAVKG